MTGKQGAAILKALEVLQAKAVADGVEDDDEYSCDSHVNSRFISANTQEMEPLQEGGKKKGQAFWEGWSEVEATDQPEPKPPPQPPPSTASHVQSATRGESAFITPLEGRASVTDNNQGQTVAYHARSLATPSQLHRSLSS